jgi:predicted Zn-dependent protease
MSYDPRNPRNQDPRHQSPHGRPDRDESENVPDAGGGLVGGILGQILGGGQQTPPEATPRQSGVISQGGRGPQVGGGLLGMLLGNPRILMFLLMAGGAVVTYFLQTKEEGNNVTDQKVRVVGSIENDIELGMQAAPGMIAEGKGEYPNLKLQKYIDDVGAKLVRANMKGDWEQTFAQYHWDFHLLADEQNVNAFALPGGQIFFTYGLFKKLKTEDEVAGVLGHEIGHVIARHSAKQMAKAKLINGMVMAGATATSDGQGSAAQAAQMVQGILTMKYGRDDERQADKLGTQFMTYAGYKPEGLIKVMEILKAEMGGASQPEFMSTHPDPGNRAEDIAQYIEDIKSGRLEGPKGVPEPPFKGPAMRN